MAFTEKYLRSPGPIEVAAARSSAITSPPVSPEIEDDVQQAAYDML